MTHDPGRAYDDVLDVLVALAAPAAASFSDLLETTAGAYPDDVRIALHRLADAGLLDDMTSERLKPQEDAPAPSLSPAAGSVLPDPHPLDGDWRFSPLTVQALLRQVARRTEPGQAVALLGCPSVLEASLTAPAGRRFVLLESATATCAALAGIPGIQVLCLDVASDPLPVLSAACVIADPPWYPSLTRAFLWAAASVSAPGAIVLLAQPGLATRPGILAERAGLLAFARQCGLRPTRIMPGGVGYFSPPFERQALDTARLGFVPDTWRHGDLIELRHDLPQVAARPSPEPADRWQETWIGHCRIRFQTAPAAPADIAPGHADPRLIRLVEGDILPSVSRRYPLRPKVRIWTGGNRVFGCRDAWLAAVIAEALADGRNPAHAASVAAGHALNAQEARRTATAARQILAVAEAENADARARSGSLAVSPGPAFTGGKLTG